MRITGSTSGFKVGSQSDNTSKDRISSLVKQKQAINDLKQSYRENALKTGKSAKEIEAKMQEYDSMITEIDSEISKITADKQKKAAQSEAKKAGNQSGKKNQDINEIGKGIQAANQQIITGLTSIQKSLKIAKSIQFAQGVLKTEALSYKPSFASHGNPVKAGNLTAKSELLDQKLDNLREKINKTADKINDASDDTEERNKDQDAAI